MAVNQMTAAALAARVGHKLDIAITDDTSVPSLTQVKQWLMDGAMLLCKTLPPNMLSGFISTKTYSEATSPLVLDIDTPRIFMVTRGNLPMRLVDPSEFALTAGIATAAAVTNPLQSVGVIRGEGGVERIEFWPDDDWDLTVHYVEWPAEPDDWGDSPENPFCPPLSWEEVLVDYAVIQGRLQDEESGLAQIAAQQWAQRVGEWSKSGAYPVDTEATS